MKRVRSTIWEAVTAVSAIFLLLTTVFWPASYWRNISLDVQDMGGDLKYNHHKQAQVLFDRGSVLIRSWPEVEAAAAKEVAERKQEGPWINLLCHFEWEGNADQPEYELEHERFGFGYETSDISSAAQDDPLPGPLWALRAKELSWKLPAWLVFLLESIGPVAWLRWRFRKRLSTVGPLRSPTAKAFLPSLGRTVTCASLVLFVLTATLWPLSHWCCTEAHFYCGSGDLRHDADSNLYFHCEHGSLWVEWLRTVYPAIIKDRPFATRQSIPDHRDQKPARRLNLEFRWTRAELPPRPTGMEHGNFGFGYSFRRNITTIADQPTGGVFFGGRPYLSETNVECDAPLWLALILESIAPAIALRSHWQKRRSRAQGLCPTCGYDLRGTPNQCPECGNVPGQHTHMQAIR